LKGQATRDDEARMGLPAAPYWTSFVTVVVKKKGVRNAAALKNIGRETND
jgi:hypothetical protein